jgi:4a-hydroxytetrahydrobiopterin dehydratase
VTATPESYGMSHRDVEAARAISAVADELGLVPDPSRVQSLLLIVESAAPASVMPFWRALLDYQPRADSPDEDLVDPRGRGPGLWFEELQDPHPGRIHVAAWVPQEQGEARMAAALAAGGRLVRDEFAPSWWTLADAAGNEADVATTANRD